MKKLINKTDNIVDEMLVGAVNAHPNQLLRLPGYNVLLRTEKKLDKVSLISGGGSGHEPAHGGYVGYGMLDAAVAGEVFTSPTPDQIYEAIKAVNNGNGVLLIVKNYTGDILNFEMAKTLAEADGIQVEQVIVNDDVAVENSTWTTGRRGIAGTLFVHKIAGAMAETGAPLEDVKRIAEKVINNVRSMGMALSPCTVPASGKPSFLLDDNEVEIGIGIHGEPGTHREIIESADNLTKYLSDKILAEIPFKENDEAAIMINGLGGTPLMELYIINKKLSQILSESGINTSKTYIGNFMTSLEMAGFSISVLKLDDELKNLLLAPCNTPALVQI